MKEKIHFSDLSKDLKILVSVGWVLSTISIVTWVMFFLLAILDTFPASP